MGLDRVRIRARWAGPGLRRRDSHTDALDGSLPTQIQLSANMAERQEEPAIAHAGAQAAMSWRAEVYLLHDRGLDPEEIRWIMYCEEVGEGYELHNGIIDEIIFNVPRVAPPGLVVPVEHPQARRLPRPGGAMRASD